jgi:predicted kinase
MQEGAAAALATGHSVVVDAVFGRPDERERIEEIARSSGADFKGIWLEAPMSLLLERVAARQGDPSDADVNVVRRQSERDIGCLAWTRLAADGSDRDWTRLRDLLS